MGKQSTESARTWFCVLNNPRSLWSGDMTPEEIVNEALDLWVEDKPKRTCAGNFEIGDTGNEHLHLVLSDPAKTRFSAVQKLYPGIHIEPMRGSKEEAEQYIRKEGKFAEKAHTVVVPAIFRGEIVSNQGKRADLDRIQQMLDGGLTPKQILSTLPFQYQRFERSIRSKFFDMKSNRVTPFRKVTVFWHVGESGTGKSHTYLELCEKYGEESVYFLTDYDTGGFDLYCGEPVLFMDEFKASMKFALLLIYLDGYKVQVHCRYSNVQALWTEVHITSVFPPDEAYRFMVDEENRDRDSVKQLLRRIDSIIYHYKEGDAYKTFILPATEYKDYDDLKSRAGKDFDEVPPNETTPFDEDIRSPPKKEESYIQVNIKDIETKDDFEIFNEVSN